MSQELYSTEELLQMTPEEMRIAQSRGYAKPLSETEARKQERLGKAIFGEDYANPTHPSPPQSPYAPTVWGSTEYDFRVPSGQLCRMKKLRPEELVGTDILDRITRLPAFAQELVDKSEGKPPKNDDMPDKKDLQAVIEVLNELIPMVVVQPRVFPVPDNPEDREPGLVYTDMIELADRIAIMERAVSGISKMDNFRPQS
jgi:hypothetical protein